MTRFYKYEIRDRETGTFIERFDNLQDARTALAEYEEQDKEDGSFTDNFYEIWDREKEEGAE